LRTALTIYYNNKKDNRKSEAIETEKDIIEYISNEMKGDFQYGQFKNIVSDYISISNTMKKMEEKQIPSDLDYENVLNLSLEAKQKLSEIIPLTIAQASRISGINPADISVLLIHLKQHY